MTQARTAEAMIRAMEPVIRPGEFVFVTLDEARAARLAPLAEATCREAEGLSAILPLAVARRDGFPDDQPMRGITLTVHSALDGVGLTAAVSGALAAAGIPCNIVAARHHDHLFVPSALAESAHAVLVALQQSAQQSAERSGQRSGGASGG